MNPSGGGSTATPKYEIKTEAENGTVTADAKTAAKGKTITLTVAAAEGYQLDSLTAAADGGKEVAVTEKENGIYTFVMPESSSFVISEKRGASSSILSAVSFNFFICFKF